MTKAQNISKAIDKRECRKQLEKRLGRKPTKKEFDKEWEGFRRMVGYKKNTSHTERGDSNLNRQKYDSRHSAFTTRDIATETLPATPAAKALDGLYSYSPKPAVEIILVVQKPLSEKSYVDQALAWHAQKKEVEEGKRERTDIAPGCVDFEGCRIPYKKADKPTGGYGGMDAGIGKPGEHQEYRGCNESDNQGRFPANLLVSDDCLNDKKMYSSHGGGKGQYSGGCFGGGYATDENCTRDSGSFSRYFSLDAWWEKRLKELPESVRRTFPFLIVPKASKAEKNRGCEGLDRKKKYSDFGLKERIENGKATNLRTNTEASGTRNYHPTVKPLKLMSYLITLGSRQGDIVLDPFIGSGTTAIAAVMTGRRYIGYETDKDYVRIANKRLAGVQLSLL